MGLRFGLGPLTLTLHLTQAQALTLTLTLTMSRSSSLRRAQPALPMICASAANWCASSAPD